eukprot:699320-Rhodomonas_salina.1
MKRPCTFVPDAFKFNKLPGYRGTQVPCTFELQRRGTFLTITTFSLQEHSFSSLPAFMNLQFQQFAVVPGYKPVESAQGVFVFLTKTIFPCTILLRCIVIASKVAKGIKGGEIEQPTPRPPTTRRHPSERKDLLV